VAALAGAGAELAARDPADGLHRGVTEGLRWILPFGAVLSLATVFCQLANRPPVLAPLAAAVVLGVVAIEVGSPGLRGWQRALVDMATAVVVYGEALVAFNFAATQGGVGGTLLACVATAALSLPRLASYQAARGRLAVHLAVVVLLVGECLVVVDNSALSWAPAMMGRGIGLAITLEGGVWSLTGERPLHYGVRAAAACLAIMAVVLVAQFAA